MNSAVLNGSHGIFLEGCRKKAPGIAGGMAIGVIKESC